MRSAGSGMAGSVQGRGIRFERRPAVNFTGLFKALDALVVLRDATRRFRASDRQDSTSAESPPTHSSTALTGPIEARLAGVVVAALKEAFDRDHARLELERAQLEEERRRAEEALRLELRRQTVDREVARLRFIAGTALVGWIAAIALTVLRLESASVLSRSVGAGGWLLLLAALGAAVMAQERVSASSSGSPGAGPAGVAALWLLIGGLACEAIAILL